MSGSSVRVLFSPLFSPFDLLFPLSFRPRPSVSETNIREAGPERAIFAYINHGRRGWHGNCFLCGDRVGHSRLLPFGDSFDALLSWEILYLSRNAELNRI